jgi:putative transposase
VSTREHEALRRRPLRLAGYDYSSSGAYFVTTCTEGRQCVLDDPVLAGIATDVWQALPRWFRDIELDEFVVMPNHVHLIVWIHRPNDAGVKSRSAGSCVEARPGSVSQSGMSEATGDRAGPEPVTGAQGTVRAATAQVEDAAARDWVIPNVERVIPSPKLGDVIGAFKSLVTRVYLEWLRTHDPTRRGKFWQRNYYEHIIRNDRELRAIREYIRDNPLQWALDRDNPGNLRRQSAPVGIQDYLSDIQMD